MGLRQTGSQISMTRPVSLLTPESEREAALQSETVPTAVAYAKEDWLKEGSNAAWKNHVDKLVQPTPDLAALTNATEAERTLALQRRAARRAYRWRATGCATSRRAGFLRCVPASVTVQD